MGKREHLRCCTNSTALSRFSCSGMSSGGVSPLLALWWRCWAAVQQSSKLLCLQATVAAQLRHWQRRRAKVLLEWGRRGGGGGGAWARLAAAVRCLQAEQKRGSLTHRCRDLLWQGASRAVR